VKNLNFSQTIRFRCTDPEKLVQMAAEWDRLQAEADLMGYMGSHILADRENPGLYLMIAEFGVVDPNVSAAEEAMKNNDREQTKAWAAALEEIVEGEIEFGNFDEIYRTG